MKSNKPQIDPLQGPDIDIVKIKIRFELANAGADGRTRTELLQALRLPRDLLTKALEEMHAAFEIVAQIMRKRAFALGRPVTRYWLAEHAPKDLTVPPVSVTKEATNLEVLPVPPTPSATGSACRQCGIAIPRLGPGRLPSYCSPACEHLAKAGGVTVADFLARVSDPCTFARCARRLVEIDLLCHGFEVTPALDQGSILIVYDASGSAALLHVLPISNAGSLPSSEGYRHAAFVFRDGRIAYGGEIPLVGALQVGEDVSPSTDQEK